MAWGGHTLLSLEDFCPGSKSMGPLYSWTLIIATLFLFGAQGIWAGRTLYKKKEVISKFYATMIVCNIFAMMLVTWRMSLCLPSLTFPLPDLTYRNATFEEMFVTNVALVLFPTHTCNNVCRVVYDMKGQLWARRMLPLAWLSQGWLLIPANIGFRLGLVFLILTGVDYCQHGFALIYWLSCLCKNVDPEMRSRYKACIIGVLAHCFSILPLLVYRLVFLGRDMVPMLICMVCMIVLMLISQHNWVRAAELTKPDGNSENTTAPDATVIGGGASA